MDRGRSEAPIPRSAFAFAFASHGADSTEGVNRGGKPLGSPGGGANVSVRREEAQTPWLAGKRRLLPTIARIGKFRAPTKSPKTPKAGSRPNRVLANCDRSWPTRRSKPPTPAQRQFDSTSGPVQKSVDSVPGGQRESRAAPSRFARADRRWPN